MMLTLFALCRCEYVELTGKSINKVIGGPRPVFIKFYSPWSGHSVGIAGDFSDAATRFPHVVFGGVNCPDSGDLCEKFGVSEHPAFRFYPPHNRTGVDYDAPHYIDDFIQFVEAKTHSKARPSIVHKLVELKAKNWKTHFSPYTCGIVLFHMHNCGDCQHLKPQLAQLTAIYENEANITIGTFNCEYFNSMCRDIDVVMYPDYDGEPGGVEPEFRIYTRGVWANYTGSMSLNSFVLNINRRCAVDRRVDGLLGENAGRIPEADAIAREFLDAANKAELIKQMKKIPGTEFYVKMMERCVDKGVDQLKKDSTAMKRNLEEKRGSPKSLDVMKKRYNILNSFLLNAAPKPTPTPVGSESDARPEGEL